MSNKFTAIKTSTSAGSKAQSRKATSQEWYCFHLITGVRSISELVANSKVSDLFNLIQKAEYNRLMIADRKDIPTYTQLAIEILQADVSLDNENGYPDVRALIAYLDSDTETTEEAA